jgi:predicted aspartyl protease
VAEVAVAEAAFRAADVDNSFNHAKTALDDDFCEARAHAMVARLYEINALFGSAAAQMETAHKLRPTDELIRRDWMDSLPRKRREEELAKYLTGDHALSQDDSRDYDNELSHLKARKPGECRITSTSDTAKTPMKPVYGDNSHPVAFGLDVSFDGKRRRMQIDTGASGILLTQSAARGLGLQPEFHLKTGGIGDEGDSPSYLAHVHSIRIGDIEVTDCMVEVVTKSKLDVDGLIGMDVFARWIVTLDYQNAELRLAPLPPRPGSQPVKTLESNPLPGDIGDEADIPKDRYAAPEMKNWLAVARIGHEILLPAAIKKNGPLTHFMIMDTGASQSVMSNALGKEGGKLHGSSVEFTGLSGKVKKVYETDELPLFIGSIAIPPAMYYAYDITNISHNSGFETSGLLGLPTLQRVLIQIDYRDDLIKFTYDPNHDLLRF